MRHQLGTSPDPSARNVCVLRRDIVSLKIDPASLRGQEIELDMTLLCPLSQDIRAQGLPMTVYITSNSPHRAETPRADPPSVIEITVQTKSMYVNIAIRRIIVDTENHTNDV